ncbi:helix-turn-helix domain-containing protein [Paenibacillus sp. Soil750]|uniref:helix-turn-helix domain-containing protein n=1 Tax=Paenibacillus sp. Soil750 TaxID=1736398 RepID=UPI0007C72696|nr:helix-turn-helix transcriptional regulator [Paenibacillus sp. Soil750]
MDAHNFGKYLKEQRKIRGLTLVALGKATDLSQPYLSQIENGKKGTPSPEILKKLEGPLGISYEELMFKAGYWRDSYSKEDKDLFEEIHNEEWDLNNKISKLLKSIADDDGHFPDYLHKDIFKIFVGWLILNDGNRPSHDYDRWYFANYINNEPEDDISKEELELVKDADFDRIYNYTTLKNAIIAYEGYKKTREDFLNELIELMNNHGLTVSYKEQEKTIGHPLYIDLSEILDSTSLTSIHYKGRALTKNERYQIIGMLDVLFPDRKE